MQHPGCWMTNQVYKVFAALSPGMQMKHLAVRVVLLLQKPLLKQLLFLSEAVVLHLLALVHP